MDDLSADETIYRCLRCGKWSHAKRKPSKHYAGVTTTPGPDDIIVKHQGGWAEFDQHERWTIVCGPFATYTARRTG